MEGKEILTSILFVKGDESCMFIWDNTYPAFHNCWLNLWGLICIVTVAPFEK